MQTNLPNIYYYIDQFNLSDLSKLNNKISIIYRNYKKEARNETIYSLKSFCKTTKRKLFIANDIKLAINFRLDGVYIPSFNKKINFASTFCYPANFKIIGSAHNIKEIKIKKLQKCSEIFISPIFKTKKSTKFLDILKFNNLTLAQKSKYIALGGINKKNFKRLRLTKISGFAGISGIKKNGLR